MGYKKCLIVLDFDHTVFNTTLFVEMQKRVFEEKFGITEQEFMKKRNAVKECCTVIDMDKFTQSLTYEDKEEMHLEIEKILEQNAKDWIFSDVRSFILKHQEECDFLMLTHGDEELQNKKFSSSGLPDFVEFLPSLESKDKVLSPYVKEYSEIYFVDDKSKNIDQVKSSFSKVKTFFIKRPEDKPYGDIPSECDCADKTIESLEEIFQ